MSASFDKLATTTASTKRSSVSGAGVRTGFATNLSSLSCTPLAPASADIVKALDLETPYTVMQTFVDDGLDIIAGDLFVVGSDEYEVRAVEKWPWSPSGSTRLRVILQESRR